MCKGLFFSNPLACVAADSAGMSESINQLDINIGCVTKVLDDQFTRIYM